MKRILTAAMALSLIGGSAAMAQPYGHDNRNDHRDDRRMEQRHDNHAQKRHHWTRGQRVPATYYNSRSRYVDYRAHHLRQPPRGYQWVRDNNSGDYLMVALATGLIASVLASQ